MTNSPIKFKSEKHIEKNDHLKWVVSRMACKMNHIIRKEYITLNLQKTLFYINFFPESNRVTM